MPQLRLSLTVLLHSYSIPEPFRPVGALFHRWVPDGRADAIVLSTPDSPAQVSVWFERRAANRSGFLTWQADGNEFDVAIMGRQGKLDGGYLRGEIVLNNVSDDEVGELRKDAIEVGKPSDLAEDRSPLYVGLAKRIVKVVQPPLERFLDTLRYQYGQYWIEPLQPWDSRAETLGSYCNGRLNLAWHEEATGKRYRLTPTPLGFTVRVQPLPRRGYAEYITEADWRRMQKSQYAGLPSIELQLLGRAAHLIDSNELRQAYVEGVTALELATERKLPTPPRDSPAASAVSSFLSWNSTANRTATILLASGVPLEDVEQVLLVFKKRNSVVHDGATPDNDDVEALRRVLSITARFIGLAEFKQPTLSGSNMVGAGDDE